MRKTTKFHLLLISFVLISPIPTNDAKSEDVLVTNPSFEDRVGAGGDVAPGWFRIGQGGEVSVSTIETPYGDKALLMETWPGGKWVGVRQFLVDDLASTNLTLSASFKNLRGNKATTGLWMSALLIGKQLASANSGPGGLRGVAGWQREEISLKVPPETHQVVIGIWHKGAGAVLVDSVRVSAKPIAEGSTQAKTDRSKAKTEEVDSKGAASDSTLLSCNNLEWVNLASYVSTIGNKGKLSPAGMERVGKTLDTGDIIMLGEQCHGVAEFNVLKTQIAKYLWSEEEIDVIAFESGFFECSYASVQLAESKPEQFMRACIYPIWHTVAVQQLLEYLNNEKERGSDWPIWGIDPKISGPILAGRQGDLVFELLQDSNKDLAVRLRKLFSKSYPPNRKLYRQFAEYYAHNQESIEETLNSGISTAIESHANEYPEFTPFDRSDWLSQLLRNWRARFKGIAHELGTEAANRVRDEMMGDNLMFMMEVTGRDDGILVWSANAHVAKLQEESNAPSESTSIAQALMEHTDTKIITLGFYHGGGMASWPGQPNVPVSVQEGRVFDLLRENLDNGIYLVSDTDRPRSSESHKERIDNTGFDINRLQSECGWPEGFNSFIFVTEVTPASYIEVMK